MCFYSALFLRFFFLAIFCGALVVSAPSAVYALSSEDAANMPLRVLLSMASSANNKGEYLELEAIINAITLRYEAEAISKSASLPSFPTRDKVEDYSVMNDVANALFIRGESLRDQSKSDEAVHVLEQLINDFPYAQSWDPSRGGFWSIAEKSREIINQIKGIEEDKTEVEVNATKPVMATPGLDSIVDYTKFGTFEGIGTREYKFVVGNPNALSKAVGEGIFPNTGDVLKNPGYKEAFKQNRLKGSHWDHVNTRDLEAAYFKWSTAPEEPGVKLFYTGLTFEKAGLFFEAIKAYYAILVHFPRSVGVTYWHTPWYPAQAAVGKIKNILRQNPSLGWSYKGGKVQVINGDDNETANDDFIIWPGTLVRSDDLGIKTHAMGEVRRELGGSKAKLIQYENGDWKMFVDGKPFIIKALTYMPTRIGQTPDKNTVANWMLEDSNNNGIPDSPYESWVDKNGNDIQDADEPAIGDFQLMKDMGVNALRLYHHPQPPEKKVLRDLYDRYGIMVIMGDFLGKYTLGSGADWTGGTDYENKEHRENMIASVIKAVEEFKDEPYVMMWLLGNENNYGVASNADKKPEAYFKFANEVAQRIKAVDPTRPVALCNGDILFLEKFAKNAPDIDVFGANVYRGDYGFGMFWDQVKQATDKPAFITEYGAPAYSKKFGLEAGDAYQASYHRGAWMDIMANSAGRTEGEGNAIGGVAFEWLDEWWKNYDPYKHDVKADVIGPFIDGYYFEEWFGIAGQGAGKNSPFQRNLRKTYAVYKELWNK